MENVNLATELERTLAFLKEHGQKLDVGEWLSIRDYAKKHGLTTQVVTNWIDRGTIPADCVEELPMFNNIRMVRERFIMRGRSGFLIVW